jgi:hypothetical protein
MKMPAWLKSNRALREENKNLVELVKRLTEVAQSINTALNYNINEQNLLREESLAILGSIALQHSGEILVKNQFRQILINQENMKVVLEQKDEGILIKVVEGYTVE